MTPTKQRPIARSGDLAYVPSAGGFGGVPLFRVASVETDATGTITAYYLSDMANLGAGNRIEPQRVVGIFRNCMNED